MLHMNAKTILAKNLKTYRKFFHLSQLELALQSDLSFRGYGKIERQEVAASMDTLDKLACGTGLPVELLVSEQMEQCLPYIARV